MKVSPDSSLSLIDRFHSLIETVPASDRLLLRLAFFGVLATGIWLFFSLNTHFSEDTPIYGGTFVEGIIGTPRYINPVLATTRADQDLTSIIYSSLLKINPLGDLENDIAKEIVVSDDGLTYNITLRDDIKFHDGTSLTADDVIYTIQLIQDPDLKSPLRGNWTDVTVEKLGEFEVNVVLEEAYAPFIENFTVGIMPAHAWSGLPIEQLPFSKLNTEPIGSGPFMIIDPKLDASGLINHYTLSAFRDYTTNPKISTMKINFYKDEASLLEAMAKHEIDATAYVPPSEIAEVTSADYQLIEESLPRTFGVFFNQNRSAVLRDTSVREALSIALDRDAIIEKSFHGHGVPMSTPVNFADTELESADSVTSIENTPHTEQAIDILKKAGWNINALGSWEKVIDKETVGLSIVLRTSNTPLFDSISNVIAEQWRAIGVEVTIEQFEQTGLVQSVIRPRDFEALLFGHDITRSYDLYSVWHSSQKDDPGLNISQYANITVDGLLAEARVEQSKENKLAKLKEASDIISKERPAVFIAQPTLTYVIDKKIVTAEMNNLGRPSDRFYNIAEWHTESDSLWPVFKSDME